ncbi:hypothetical protein GLOIN_2v1847779 [Rhizophagus clarus]|uniref:Uncharacterized protein n=1 Tax=Rhizophagus clarus TaxID=94130 RepID=A0A8H3KPZ1_9GLOM|nr:hypothetical protein GLOIN_2v1847779 [Rhizophagus clarus]
MVREGIATQTLTILKENKFTSSSEEIIARLEAIILGINGEIVELNFRSDNIADFTQRLDSIIRAYDEALISRDSYCKAIPNLIREHINIKLRSCEKYEEKTKHVMITMCILNEGKESYDPLSTVPAKFSHELEQLKTDGYKDPNNIDLAR